jgi:16S rRNA (guanine966-N2)-methyltransferase
MKLRVISGKYGGRTIESPPGHKTHPTSEKIRGSVFNALGDIEGLEILDAYSGSGAFAIESISRGAKYAVAIDKSKDAIATINHNVKTLNITNIKVTQANISSWINNNNNAKFDIIICDPPFDKINQNSLKLITSVMKKEGVIVFILPNIYEINLNDSLKLLKHKNYGDAKVLYYNLKCER